MSEYSDCDLHGWMLLLGLLIGVFIMTLVAIALGEVPLDDVQNAVLCAKAGHEPDIAARTCVIEEDGLVLECDYVHADGITGLECEPVAERVLERRLG